MRLPFALPSATGNADITAFGENSLDYVMVEVETPTLSGKHSLQSFDRHVGGQAATAAVACSRQGVRARYVGVFGSDETGAFVRAKLVVEGVDVVAIERPGASSRTAVILVDPAGERTVYEYRDPRLALDTPQSVADKVAGARVLMVDATDITAAIAAAAAARAAAIPTLVDIDKVTPEAHQLLSLIDLIVVPEPFVLAFTGATSVGDGLAQLDREFSPALIVVTLAAEGSVALVEGREIRTPGFRVPVTDTTGAGDAFRGGLVSAWVRGGENARLEDVLAAANATAALNCRAVGAQTALPALSEVEGLLTQTGLGRSN